MAKKKLLWISQISLNISVRINWFSSKKIFCSQLNQWKGKSLIQFVKIWLIQIQRVEVIFFLHWEKTIFESKNISLIQINGWAECWRINIFLDQRNIFIVFKKWIIKAKKCFSSTIKYSLDCTNILLTLCSNYLIREVNSLM